MDSRIKGGVWVALERADAEADYLDQYILRLEETLMEWNIALPTKPLGYKSSSRWHIHEFLRHIRDAIFTPEEMQALSQNPPIPPAPRSPMAKFLSNISIFGRNKATV